VACPAALIGQGSPADAARVFLIEADNEPVELVWGDLDPDETTPDITTSEALGTWSQRHAPTPLTPRAPAFSRFVGFSRMGCRGWPGAVAGRGCDGAGWRRG
jgi:hypothetical protein